MCLLKKILNNKSSDDETLIDNLAKEVGYTRSAITKFKNEKNHELKNFNGLVKMVKLLDLERETDIMIDYSSHIDANNITAKSMLEYLSVNRSFEAMSTLLERMHVSSNSDSKLWATVYELIYKWQTRTQDLDLDSFLNEVNKIKTKKNVILDILQRFLKCYVYDLKLYYNQVLELSNEIVFLISEIKDEYLKTVFTVRVNEVLANINLWVLNNPCKARQYAEEVIVANIGQGFNAYAHYIIAQSYFYISYNDAKKYYIESMCRYEKIGRFNDSDDIRITIEFLDIYWANETNKNDFLSKENEVYSKVKNGYNDEIDIHNFSDAYCNLLKGIRDDNTDTLLQSMIQYLKGGDAFSSNLSKNELLKRGFSEIVLNELIKIYDK